MLYRQGDILLKPIAQFPNGIKKKNLVLAYGEATGHCHQFMDSNIVSVFELNQQQYVEISNNAELFHEEHDNLIIPKGKYEVIRQQEVDLTNELRRIED